MATYASTGAAGIDVEVDYAALLAVCLIAERGDRALPPGASPWSLSLQRRDGPAGFDDIVLEWRRDIEVGITFVQSKRTFSVGDNAEFRDLARALAAFEDERDWSAAIVTSSLTPAISDVQSLLESARSSTSKADFDRTWAAEGALNAAKRQVLRGFAKATEGLDEDAAWNAMRRLRLIEHDLSLPQSRDRQWAINLLSQQLIDPSTADAAFGSLRSTLLAAAQLAPTFNRATLLARVPGLAAKPTARLRPAIDRILAESSSAARAINDRLQGAGHAVTLLRPDSWSSLQEAAGTSRIIRLTGDAGCGKSSLLKRYSATFGGNTLVLSERQIAERSWSQAAANWGTFISAEEIIASLASSGACLLAIDGADRMLLDPRRELVLELFSAIAASPLGERWSIITSGRDFGQRDLVRDALREAGLEVGERVSVGSLDDADAATVVLAFPAARALLSRSDLAGLNRNPFMLQQLLVPNELPTTLTEIGLADAWATRGARTTPAAHGRDTVVAQLAAARVAAPAVVPSIANLDPEGIARLVEEGSAARLPLRDGIVFTHDVLEDWALARELQRDWRRMADRLRSAGQPLWWQRAVRLAAQMLLEAGRDEDWRSLLDVLDQDDLDAAWGRLVLVAPLHSESAADLLPRIQPILLADNARLLGRLLETLRVAETRIREGLLDSPLFEGMSEAERFRLAAQFKTPVWRPWVAFMRWALPHWQSWPDSLLMGLVELAEIWTSALEWTPSWISAHIAEHVTAWLTKVEDYRHPEGSRLGHDERERPFELELRYHGWEELEATLRRVLTMTVAAAPQLVESYLERVTSNSRLRGARTWLLENPRQVPAHLPGPWTVMMRTELLRRRRQRRDGLLGPSSCFDSPMAFNEAGISDHTSFYPSSPLQGGWDQLFEHDADAALAMMHRLEMRAAVFWRNWAKRYDGRRPRPLILHLPSGPIQLWGDDTVYRWSRATLGPNALGSAYLALDDWLEKQLGGDARLAELLPRVLQNNGLVATAAPIINVVAQRQNDRPALSAIAPFLSAPRLWSYDVRRHLEDQTPTHRIPLVGGPRYRHHVDAAEAVWQRYRQRGPLHHQLLLPFHLLADQEAQALLQERRVRWQLDDLADYDDELGNDVWRAEHEATLARFQSDADPSSMKIEEGPEPNQIAVRIEPPEDSAAEAEAVNREQSRAGALSSLAVWAHRSLEEGAVGSAHTLTTALESLVALERPDDAESADMPGRFSRAAAAGVAAVIARFGAAAMIEEHADWLRQCLWAAVTRERTQEEAMFLIPETVLTFDPQMLAAGGLAALASRGLMPEFEQPVAELVTSELHAVEVSTLRGLDWANRPNFAWRCAVAALDMCVIDSTAEWLSPRERARGQRAYMRRRQAAVAYATGRGKSRLPLLPPRPYRDRWRRSGRLWPPIERVRLRALRGLHWGRVKSLLDALPFSRLTEPAQRQLRNYLLGLAAWAMDHRDADERRLGYHDEFPHDLANTLAHALGRLAAFTGDGDSWHCLKSMDFWHREGDLVSVYLDEVVRELVDSGRAPDERFWNAWRPAAEWVMATLVPKRPDDDWDNLGEAVRAAGLVGPYMTPLPPDWPHLELVLPMIDAWVAKTAHHPSAARAMLAIGERMPVGQRERWLLPWLEKYAALHGRDPGFWMYGELADGAAGLLPALDDRPAELRQRVRQLLSIMADTGSLSARELLPRFAPGRQV